MERGSDQSAARLWIAAFVGPAGALGILAVLSSETLGALADLLAVDGTADFCTPAFLRGLRAGAGVLAVFWGLLGWFLRDRRVRFHEAVSSWAHGRREGVSKLVAALRGGVSSFFHTSGKTHVTVFALLLAAAAGLRVYYSATLPLRNDEAHTFEHFVFRPLVESMRDYTYPNNHLFHTFLAHVMGVFFGRSVWALRLPSVVSGILACVATYGVVRALYGKTAGLLAMGLVGGSSYLVEYSSVARGYSLCVLFFLLLVGSAQYMRRVPGGGGVGLFVLFSSLGLFTLPTMVHAVGIVVAWQYAYAFRLGSGPERRRIVRDMVMAVLGCAMVTAALYAPLLHYSGLGALVRNKYALATGFRELAGWFLSLWHRDVPVAVAAGIVAGLLAVLLRPVATDRRDVPLAVVAIAWFVPLFFLPRLVGPERTWMFLLPVYLGTGAAGIVYLVKAVASRIGGRRPAWVAPVAILAVSLWGSGVTLARQSPLHDAQDAWVADAVPLVQYLTATLGPDDHVVVACPSDKIVLFYARRSGLGAGPFYHVPDAGGPAYLVVNELAGDLEATLRAHEQLVHGPGFVDRMLSPPQEVKRFSSTVLYELELGPYVPPEP